MGEGKRGFPPWSLSLVAGVLFVAAAADNIYFLARYGIHEDVLMVLAPAKNLVRNCDLTHGGYAIPSQLSKWNRADGELRFPFWANYLAPVFYFAPFVALFPTRTALPFLVGQSVAIFLLLGFVIWRYRRQNALWENLLLGAFLALSQLNGFGTSPTQVLYAGLFALIWNWRTWMTTAPVPLGVLFGVAAQVRPEAYLLLAGMSAASMGKRTVRPILLTAVTCVAVVWSTGALRHQLGGVSSSDHNVYVIGDDVLDEDSGVFFGTRPHAVSEFFTPRAAWNLIWKVGRGVFALPGSFDGSPRRDSWLVCVLFTYWFVVMPHATPGERRDIATLLFYFVASFLVAQLGIAMSRYADLIYAASLIYIAEQLPGIKSHWNRWLAEGGSGAVRRGRVAELALQAFLFGFVAFECVYFFHVGSAVSRERDLIGAAEAISQIVPKNGRVLCRYPELWLWYADGEQAVFYDNAPILNSEFERLYAPDAVILHVPQGTAPPTTIGPLSRRLTVTGIANGWAVYMSPLPDS